MAVMNPSMVSKVDLLHMKCTAAPQMCGITMDMAVLCGQFMGAKTTSILPKKVVPKPMNR